MTIRDMNYTTVEQVLALREAALKMEKERDALAAHIAQIDSPITVIIESVQEAIELLQASGDAPNIVNLTDTLSKTADRLAGILNESTAASIAAYHDGLMKGRVKRIIEAALTLEKERDALVEKVAYQEKTIEIFKGAFNRNQARLLSMELKHGISEDTSQPDNLTLYTLCYNTVEHATRELELRAYSDADAIGAARKHLIGGEGLISGIELLDDEFKAVENKRGWF